MLTFNLSGILTDVFRAEQVSHNLTKRVFWVKEPDTERYPQHWELELHNDDCRRLDDFRIGQRVDCQVELRGKLWDKGGKKGIFNSLKCVGMKLVGASTASPFKQ
jgi:hypothetical protein